MLKCSTVVKRVDLVAGDGSDLFRTIIHVQIVLTSHDS